MEPIRLKVLVADDSPFIHTLFARIAELSSVEIELIHAHDGVACKNLLIRGDVDLAFIDVNMPGLSGMDAVSVGRREGADVFVTLMSSNANRVRMQLAQQLKVYEFLAKPFGVDEIEAILRSYLRATAPSKALIVDDSGTVRRIIKKILDRSIFRLVTEEAADGKTALARCLQTPFEVVFLDCNMPGMNGLQTLEVLRRRHPDTKVIMISGAPGPTYREEALRNGAFAFLAKPFLPADIDRELHAVFGLKMPLLAAVPPLKVARKSEDERRLKQDSWTE